MLIFYKSFIHSPAVSKGESFNDLRVGAFPSHGMWLLIAGLWIKRWWTKPREPQVCIYMGIVYGGIVNWRWLVIHFQGFGPWFYEKIAFQHYQWPFKNEITIEIGRNLIPWCVLVLSPFVGVKNTSLSIRHQVVQVMGVSSPKLWQCS